MATRLDSRAKAEDTTADNSVGLSRLLGGSRENAVAKTMPHNENGLRDTNYQFTFGAWKGTIKDDDYDQFSFVLNAETFEHAKEIACTISGTKLTGFLLKSVSERIILGQSELAQRN